MSFIDKFTKEEKHTRQHLNEASLSQLYKKTKRERPKVDARASKLIGSVKFMGISDDCITLNFKVNSQTYPGQYWYTSIEAPSILSEFGFLYNNKMQSTDARVNTNLTNRFKVEHYNELLMQKDFRIYTNDPSFLYWGSAYMATAGDYDIVPETRDPIIRNPFHRGALDKHAQAVVYCMYADNNTKREIIKEINRVLKLRAGLSPDEREDVEAIEDTLNEKRGPRVMLSNVSNFIDNYFASKAHEYNFIRPNNVKQSLKRDINKYIHEHKGNNIDSYLKDTFSMTKDSFADDMQINKADIDQYFNALGFTSDEEKAKEKMNTVINVNKKIDQSPLEEPEPEIEDLTKPNIV